jgi:alpha-L-rhamnosidase
MYGRIESKWTLNDDVFQLEVTIPPNTDAVVHLPTSRMENITEQGHALEQVTGIAEVRQEGETTVLHIGSGQYTFAVTKG